VEADTLKSFGRSEVDMAADADQLQLRLEGNDASRRTVDHIRSDAQLCGHCGSQILQGTSQSMEVEVVSNLEGTAELGSLQALSVLLWREIQTPSLPQQI